MHHLALVKGKIDKNKPALVRVHSECLTGDVFGSRRCDCGNHCTQHCNKFPKKAMACLLHAPGRSRNWSGRENSRLQVAGTRARHRGSNTKLGLRPTCAITDFGAQIFSISASDNFASDNNREESRWLGRLWIGNGRNRFQSERNRIRTTKSISRPRRPSSDTCFRRPAGHLLAASTVPSHPHIGNPTSRQSIPAG